jgi:glycosyltransferase involved in cell wall biosynthesis
VPVGDVDGLAAAMRRLLDDEALYLRMASAARRQAEERFRLASVVDKTIAVYRRVAAGGGP